MRGSYVVHAGAERAKALEFGAGPGSVYGRLLTPWARNWASHSASLYCLHKRTGRLQVFDQKALPVWRSHDSLCPSAWAIEEDDGQALIGINCVATAHPNLGPPRKAGFHVMRWTEDSLEVLNRDPMPFVVFAAWMEDADLVLAGMTFRDSYPEDSSPFKESYRAARPVLLRCDVETGAWREVPWGASPQTGVDLARDFPESFPRDNPFHAIKTEAWIAAHPTRDGDRVLVAGLANAPMIDNVPHFGSYRSVAFVSLRTQRLLLAEQGCQFVRTLYSPERDLSVFCRPLRPGRFEYVYPTLGGLHAVSPAESSGIEFLQMTFDGLSPDLQFRSFEASYFEEVGFFGTIQRLDDQSEIVQSPDGTSWRRLTDTSAIERTLAANLLAH